MTTLGDMINEVLINLAGYTYQQDRSTYLTAAVTTTTQTSLALASSDNVGKGIIEINDELLWVDFYDRLANTATVAPYGRGYLGSTAATAAIYDKVTISPTFPRFSIKRAINDTINAIGSQVKSLKTTSFTFNSAVATYAFGNLNIQSIQSVSYQTVGPSKVWQPIRNYRFDSNANYAGFTTFADTGATPISTDKVQTLTIADIPTSGRTVQVVYYGTPSTFTTSAETFTTQTGFTESIKDVVIYGAIYRLLAFLDPAKAAMVSPQADETDSKRPFGTSGSTTKQIYALFQQRLNEEIKNQQAQNPIRVHYAV